MSARWVAASVRARALPARRLGTAGVEALAASGSLAEAVEVLAASPYGRFVGTGDPLAAAQHAVAETLLWHLRVLAGWLPPDGVRVLQLLAGWFEIANVDERVQALTAIQRAEPPPFRLGALATAWPRLSGVASPAALRTALAGSPWRDPGGHSPREIALGLRTGWADRVAAGVPAARAWAAGALALLVARELFVTGERLPPPAAATAASLLGRAWPAAGSLDGLARVVPATARWALAGVDQPADLWRAEARWWSRVRADGTAMLTGSGFELRPVVGAVALLAVDAWQVRAALEIAARAGTPGAAGAGSEVLDAVE